MQAAITDVAIDTAGNVWVANNWDLPYEGFKKYRTRRWPPASAATA